MQFSLSDIFPELNIKLDPSFFQPSLADLENNRFFNDLLESIVEEYCTDDGKNNKSKANHPFPLKDLSYFTQVKPIIAKILPKVIPIKVPKGTIIYDVGSSPQQGYFLIHGCVQLLSKKNSWQKMESFKAHTLFTPEERVQFLYNNFHIDPKHFALLQSVFYQDQMSFNYLSFRKLLSGQYFGFKELLRGCLRTKMAIATEDSILLKVKRQNFDKYLKDFQENREFYIMNSLLKGVKPEIVEQILTKLPTALNSAQLINFRRDQAIIKQGDFATGIYFLLAGEVVASKEVKIEVPKKYLSNQNQKNVVRQMTIKLHKLIKNSFIGEAEPFLSIKYRELSFTSALHSTVLLKLDSGTFLKVVGESALFERDLTFAAKYKYSLATDNYLKQKSQIMSSYMGQLQQFDHKKKEKNITGLLNNDANFKQNQLYELFKKEGVFYRDTFERLEGFQQFQSKYDPKRSSIHRHKIKSNAQPPNTQIRTFKKEAKTTEQRSIIEQQDISFEATKKMLMSPSKTASNAFQFIGSQLVQKLSPISQHKESSSLRKKRKGLPKFQELKRDQAIYKRVLIKNGKFDMPRETNKSNIVQAIVNHQFDQIVKQCMSRNNIALRKALIDNREDLVKEEFRKTVTSLTQKSTSLNRFGSTSIGLTCKGTEEMRKKMDKLRWNKVRHTQKGDERGSEELKLDQCIGFNKEPISRNTKHRMANSATKTNFTRSPEKLVLLNHMMKPITYTSTQI